MVRHILQGEFLDCSICLFDVIGNSDGIDTIIFRSDNASTNTKKERLSQTFPNFLITRAAPRNGLTDVTSTVNSAQAPSRHTGDST